MATFLFCAMFSPFVLLGFILFARYLLYQRSKFRPKGYGYDEEYKALFDSMVKGLCKPIEEDRLDTLRKNIDKCDAIAFTSGEVALYLTYFSQWLNLLRKDFKSVTGGRHDIDQYYDAGHLPLKDYRSYCKKFDSYLSDSKKLIEACERCVSKLTSFKNTSGIIIEGEFIEVKHRND